MLHKGQTFASVGKISLEQLNVQICKYTTQNKERCLVPPSQEGTGCFLSLILVKATTKLLMLVVLSKGLRINLTTNYANQLKDGGTLDDGLYANELL